jgi:Mg/Co/Ni transporter MgtE
VLTLPDDCNAGEARDRIAGSAQPVQVRIYVLDRSRRIRGAIRGLSLLQVPSRRSLTAVLEPAEALWAREPLATAQDHQVWERNTEAPVINRDEEFIGVISYTDLRKAHRETTRAPDGNGRHDLAEVTELIAIGAGSVWQSLGDLIRREREK